MSSYANNFYLWEEEKERKEKRKNLSSIFRRLDYVFKDLNIIFKKLNY